MDENTITKRRERLLKIAHYHGLMHDGEPDTDYTGGEDFRDLLDDLNDGFYDHTKELWAVVTTAAEYRYIKLAANFDRAVELAIENVRDSIFAESPYEIVNLDTGAGYSPLWRTITWRRNT